MERKLNALARAALRFKGCSNRLVDAAYSLQKHSAGSKGLKKAAERYRLADEKYAAAELFLDEVIDEFVNLSK